MTNIANLLKNSSKDELIDLFAEMYNTVLTGADETADSDLFLALENNDLQKAKEVYEKVFKPFFELKADHKEAA